MTDRNHGRLTREECIRQAGEALAAAYDACAQMTPREQAEAAVTPGGPYDVEELEDLIRHQRGLEPVHRDEAAMAALLARDDERLAELQGGGRRSKSVGSDGE